MIASEPPNGEIIVLESVLATVMSQADKAIFDYRAECGRRGDGEWAEQLATALAQILTTARRPN